MVSGLAVIAAVQLGLVSGSVIDVVQVTVTGQGNDDNSGRGYDTGRIHVHGHGHGHEYSHRNGCGEVSGSIRVRLWSRVQVHTDVCLYLQLGLRQCCPRVRMGEELE